MKQIILFSLLLLNFSCFSNGKRGVFLPDHWEIVSVEKNKSIVKGQSKLKLKVTEKDNLTPIGHVKIYINSTTLIGITDSLGILITNFSSGENKFCADTPDSNSFTTNHTFLDQHYYVINVRMDRLNPSNPNNPRNFIIASKPVIYLYPEKIQTLNIKVEPKRDFLFTYPIYPENGWEVTGSPSGKMEYNKRFYNYLFWEAPYPEINEKINQNGFSVNSDTLIQFFENTLTKIGLSEIEQADFITYWCPRMMVNQLNFIHFYFNDDIEKYIATLHITPAPESMIRVFMTYHALEEELKIKPQLIPTYERNGFTVVEWGGSQN